MINDVQNLIDQYVAWLKDKTQLRQIEGAVEITTPFLDRHNDYLQIYAIKKENSFVLTDDSYIINDLQLSGCELNTPKRKELLSITLNGFGVQLDASNALNVKVTPENFARKKHDLLQAMLAINDLFCLASSTVSNLFYEDVSAWLNESNIRCTPNVKLAGKSGYDHMFDFIIPQFKNYPERIIQTINKPTKDTAQTLAFSWTDIQVNRKINTKMYAFLNDSDKKTPVQVLDALMNYGISPVLWSEREKVKDELAA